MKKLTLLFLLILLPLMASADAININDIYYNLDFSTKNAEVTSNPNYYTGNVVIPASVTFKGSEYSVTLIGEKAFYNCSDLTSVTIPNSVKSIGYLAFCCSGLTSVTIPNSVKSIERYAFSGSSGLTSVTIGTSVTSIGEHAFAYTGLTTITIPSSVKSIGEFAFPGLTSVHITDLAAWCNIYFSSIYSNPLRYAHHLFIDGNEIKDLVIPSSVTYIGQNTFYNCSGLTSVTISNSVKSIGAGAFYGCSGLTSINIPNSVISIGSETFRDCSGLTSITIPNSVTSIGIIVFDGCSGLESIFVESGNPNYDSRDNCNAIIETSTNTLIAGCKNTTILNSVTSIGNSAFSGCTRLTSVTIPNSVTKIEFFAFNGCTGLTSFIIPNSVTSIGDCAFQNCTNLISVTIPNSVKKIDNFAFGNCSSLTNVYCYAEKIPTTDSGAFSDIKSATLYVLEHSLANYKSTVPWSRFGTIKGIIPLIDGIYYSLDTNTKQATVTSGDTKYKGDVVIPSRVTFNDTEYSVTCIDDSAFYRCDELTSISIPNSVTEIRKNAVSDCSKITDVYCYTENVPTTSTYAFSDTDIESVTLHVFESSVANYKSSAPWSRFGTIKGIRPLIDGIYYHLDYNTKQATVTTGDVKYADSVVIPSSITFNDTEYSVTCIGDSAFHGCDDLTSVLLPNTITSIGNAAIANCIELADVYCYAKQVPTTGSDVFKDSYINYVTLYVPASAANAYKTTAPWSEFGAIVALPDPFLRGDANCDGEVNIFDAKSVVNYILGNPDETLNIEAADANQDGEIGMPDVMFIMQKKLTGRFPDEKDYFYLGTTKPTAENYTTLPEVVTIYTIEEVQGTTVSVSAGETLYMLCPAGWMQGKNVELEDENGDIISFSDEIDDVTISGYTIYKTQVLDSDKKLMLKTESSIAPSPEYIPRTGGTSPYIAAVDEYVPAPGQLVNTMPQYEDGDNAATMAQKCTDYLANKENGSLVTLGAYGGYITFHFDHSVKNVPGEYDLLIKGNAFYQTGSTLYGSCEPGIVMVSQDTNNNGIPDDGWFELSGSADVDSVGKVIYGYECTYTYTPMSNIPWSDNMSNSGTVDRNMFHAQEYFPLWLADKGTLTFSGTRLPNNAHKVSSIWGLDALRYGYVDNKPNTDIDGNSFKIDWAVDPVTRTPVSLQYVDFVRVYSALNQKAGNLGETSTEICGAKDLHMVE